MEQTKLKQGQKYKILWIDTFSYSGWYNSGELLKKAKQNKDLQETIAFYVNEGYGYLCLVSTKNPNPEFAQWGHPIWIPMGCIKKIKKLKE